MAMCKCGKCAACKKKKMAGSSSSKSYNKGSYTEAKDKKKDAAMTRGMTAAEKRQFEKKDKAHGDKKKPKTMAEDRKIDAKIIASIKAKRKK